MYHIHTRDKCLLSFSDEAEALDFAKVFTGGEVVKVEAGPCVVVRPRTLPVTDLVERLVNLIEPKRISVLFDENGVIVCAVPNSSMSDANGRIYQELVPLGTGDSMADALAKAVDFVEERLRNRANP